MAIRKINSRSIEDSAISAGDVAAGSITTAKIASSVTLTTPTIDTITSAAATALTLKSAGTTAVTIDTSQNVGIGTASPTDNGGYGKIVDIYGSTGGAVYLHTSTSTNYAFLGKYNSSTQLADSGSAGLTFATASGSTPVERMRITSAGLVGIGTTSPTSPFQVNTAGVNTTVQINSTDANGGYGAVLALNNTGTGGRQYAIYSTSNADGDVGGGKLKFYDSTASTTRMLIDSSGNVGINQAPSYRLDIADNFNGPVIRVINSRDTTGSYGIKVTLGASGGAGTTGSAHFHGNTNAVGNWYLYGNGTTSYSSDQRLKKNIETARNGYLEDLVKLRVVKYNWNVSEEGVPKELGLIAQEVEQVFPGLVQDDANPVTEGDNTVYKQLKQSVLPFMLLKAIQELKAENDALKARLDAAGL